MSPNIRRSRELVDLVEVGDVADLDCQRGQYAGVQRKRKSRMSKKTTARIAWLSAAF